MKEQDNMNKKIKSAKIKLKDRMSLIYIKEFNGFFIEFSLMIEGYGHYYLIGADQVFQTSSPNFKNYLMYHYFEKKHFIKGALDEIIEMALAYTSKELKELAKNSLSIDYSECRKYDKYALHYMKKHNVQFED